LPRRLAVVVALVVFAVCILSGMAAENTFAETLRRALYGMFGTLVIGLVVGGMAQKMLDENARQLEKKSEDSRTEVEPKGR
jgi:NhaP-type Na+/H+ or K+/H+ antiporter